MITLLIATRNAHKVGEIQTMLGADFQCHTLKEFPAAPNVIEDGETFSGNALKKATELAQWLVVHSALNNAKAKLDYVLADDSGLEVDALNGAPGVHSARFAALDKTENSPDADNNAKLLRLLQNVPPEKRHARFRCVMALIKVQSSGTKVPSPQMFDGACEGQIQLLANGHGGFGYDPLFVPEGFTKSFAELGGEVKNEISHRAQALAKLKNYFSKLST